jgi:hypothetical protein
MKLNLLIKISSVATADIIHFLHGPIVDPTKVKLLTTVTPPPKIDNSWTILDLVCTIPFIGILDDEMRKTALVLQDKGGAKTILKTECLARSQDEWEDVEKWVGDLLEVEKYEENHYGEL